MRKIMLIADDNVFNRKTLTRIFEEEYTVRAVGDGRTAVAQMRYYGAKIAIVLLDTVMPDMDGFAVLDAMREDAQMRAIPVIAVVGQNEQDAGLKAIRHGAADFVFKPVDPNLIRLRVASAVSRAEYSRLRAENDYYLLQHSKEARYRSVLESTGTVVIEYDWLDGSYQYDASITKHIAGRFDDRRLWQILMSDMVADMMDVKTMQEFVFNVANGGDGGSLTVRLKTPSGAKQWFRMQAFAHRDEGKHVGKIILTFNNIDDEVRSAEKLRFQAERDALTGLYNRATFFEKAAEMIAAHEAGYYVISCFDIDKFKIINDQYGNEKGDDVLRGISEIFVSQMDAVGGIVARISADIFATLYPCSLLHTGKPEVIAHDATYLDGSIPPISFSIGRYLVDDLTLPISAMYDRAALAKASVKGRYDVHIAWYDASMRDRLIQEQRIVNDMKPALENNQFEVWLQPQFNHATGALIGAEALARWRHPERGILSPALFIPVFERNGFIYEMDKFIWEKACGLLRRWIDAGYRPPPLSVNISRYDLFRVDLVSVMTALVRKYDIPIDMLRLEITETAFTESSERVVRVVKRLIESGFTVEIDDFGSGYSSLNTLKDVPAQVLKLDMRFLENNGESDRGGNILESVVRMAKWLGMAVIAEGVETMEQADYLQSIGCTYVQGFLYERPIPVDKYLALLQSAQSEQKLLAMVSVKNLNNNAFWDPASMDTLIFNSYVGAAVIIEYHNGAIELLRASDKFVKMLQSDTLTVEDALKLDWVKHLHPDSLDAFDRGVRSSLSLNDEVAFECVFIDLPGCPKRTYIRVTLRVIASAGNRYLIYGTNVNITKQRETEEKERVANEQLQAIMANISGGVAATVVRGRRLRVLFANQQFYAQRGYTQAQYEAERPNASDVIHPDDRAIVFRMFKSADEPFTIAYRVVCRDGRVRWLQCNTTFVRLPGIDERVQLTVSTDITQLREAEQKARASAEQLQAIMSNINAGVAAGVIRAGEPWILFANERYYTQLGYTKAQYDAEIDMPRRLIHEDDRERFLRTVGTAKEPFSIVYRIVRRDGEVRWLHNNIAFVHMAGIDEPVQLSVANDITEMREAERKEAKTSEQMQAIMGALNSGVSGVTFSGDQMSFVFANDRYFSMLGYTREQYEREVANGLTLIHPDDRARVEGLIDSLIQAGGGDTVEYRIRRKDGETIHLSVSISVVTLEGIEKPVVLGVASDITDMVEANQRISALSEKMQAILDNVDCGITAAEVDGDEVGYLFSNDRYYALHGYTKEQYDAEVNVIYDLIHPEDRQAVIDAIADVNMAGKDAILKYRITRRDGQERWLRTLISVRNLAEVKRPVFFSVYTDITDERLAHVKERETNAQLQFLNDTASELLSHADVGSGIDQALRLVLACFGGDRAFIFEHDDKRDICSFTYEACVDGVAPCRERYLCFPMSDAWYWQQAFRKDRFLRIHDISELGGDRAKEAAMMRTFGATSALAVTLQYDGRSIGTLGVFNPTLHMNDYENLRALADYMAIILTRRDLHAQIAKDRNMLQTMMDDTPGGFVRLRVQPDGAIATVYVNANFCRMRGLTREEILLIDGQDAMGTIHPDDVDMVRRTVAEMVATGETRSIKYRLRHVSGAYIPLSVFGRVTQGNDGEHYINAYYADPTVQEIREMSFRETLPFLLSALMRSATDIAFAMDTDCRYICCSLSLAKLLGMAHESEIVGKTDHDLFPKEIADRFRRDDMALLETNLPALEYIETVPTVGGRLRVFRIAKYVLRDTIGNTLGILGIGRDITKERDANARLKLLVSSIPGGVASYIATPDGVRITYFSDGFCDMLGYTHEEYERLSAEGITKNVFAEDVPDIQAQFRALIQDDVPIDCTFRVHTKDGGRKWVNLRGGVSERHGDTSTVNAVLYDVSEQMETAPRQSMSEEQFIVRTTVGSGAVMHYDIQTGEYRHQSGYLRGKGFDAVVRNVPQAFIDAGIISPDCTREYLAFYERLKSGESPLSVDIAIAWDGGAWRWLRENAAVITGEDGKPAQAVIVFSEIDEPRDSDAQPHAPK